MSRGDDLSPVFLILALEVQSDDPWRRRHDLGDRDLAECERPKHDAFSGRAEMTRGMACLDHRPKFVAGYFIG
jgi:hypothetical protein